MQFDLQPDSVLNFVRVLTTLIVSKLFFLLPSDTIIHRFRFFGGVGLCIPVNSFLGIFFIHGTSNDNRGVGVVCLLCLCVRAAAKKKTRRRVALCLCVWCMHVFVRACVCVAFMCCAMALWCVGMFCVVLTDCGDTLE